MAPNIGTAQLIAQTPLIDRLQTVHQGQAGAANPQNAEAMQKRRELLQSTVQQSENAEKPEDRRDPRDRRKQRRGPDEQDDEDQAAEGRHVDVVV